MADYGYAAGDRRYRHFTVREAARLQGFDDSYSWPAGPKAWSAGLKQLGNAVPVTLSEVAGRALANALMH